MPKLPTQSSCIWRVWLEMGAKFNPVSIVMYVSIDYADAFDYLETRRFLVNKKRRVYVREKDTDHRHYWFDEKFYAELLANELTDSDQYYDEDTTDDKVILDYRRKRFKPAIWRGIRRT